MSKFFELVKVNITVALCQMNIIQVSNRKKRSRAFLWAIGVGVIFLMLYMGVYGGVMTSMLAPYGLSWVVLWASQFLFSAMSLMTGLYTINGLLFESKDLDQLFAYPLRQWQIMLSKVCALVIEDWIFGVVFILPIIGVYGVITQQSLLFYFIAFIGFLMAPLLPLGIAIFFSFLTNLITAGKKSRNFLNIVITVAILVGSMLMINAAIPAPDAAVPDTASLMAQLNGFYPPASFYVEAVNGSILSFLAFLAVTVLPFIVLVWLLSLLYKTLCSRASVTKREKAKDYQATQSSKASALLQKEFKRFFSSAMYVMNTSIGMILLTVFAVSSFFIGGEIQEMMDMMGDTRCLIFLLAFCFMVAMTSTTAPSISLEGNSLWIAKTSPVQPKDILRAKMGVQLWVTLPLIIIDSAAVSIAMKFSVLEFFWLAVIPAMIALMSGYLGLMANLHYPRFDYSNVTQVVKNSASVMIAMFGMWAVLAIFSVLYFLTRGFLPFHAFAAISTVILASAVIAMRRYTYTKGITLWEQM